MCVAIWSGSLLEWDKELDALKSRIGPVFARAEVRAAASAFVDGLLSGVARKSGWQLAEQAGLAKPYRIQSLLGRHIWDADALRDKVREEVISALGDPTGVLVVDETGFLKKGTHSVGVFATILRHGRADRKTARLASSLPMPVRSARRCSTDGCICRKDGPRINLAVRLPACPTGPHLRLRPKLPATSSLPRSMPARPAPGCWRMRCMARIPR